MVARGRLLALWFVTILVLSVMPGVVPTTAAQGTPTHNSPSVVTVQATSDLIFKRGSADWKGYTAADAPLRPGDQVRVWWNLTWGATPSCTPAGNTVAYDTATDTVDTTVIGGSASAAVSTTTSRADGIDVSYTTTVQTATTNLTSAEGPNRVLALSYAVTCGVGVGGTGVTPSAGMASSPFFTVDTLAPTVTATASVIPLSGTAPVGATAGIGATVRIPYSITGATSVTFDGSAIGYGSGPVPVPASGTLEIPVNAAGTGTPAAPALNGANVNLLFRGIDPYENAKVETITVTVDNVRPTTAPTGITGSVARVGANNTATVTLDWTAATGEARKAARLVFNNGTAFTVTAGNQPVYVPLANIVEDPLYVQVFPVDNGGNVGTQAVGALLPRFTQVERIVGTTASAIPAVLPNTLFGKLNLNLGSGVLNNPSGGVDVNMTVERLGRGFLLNNTAGTADAHYRYAPPMPVAVFRPEEPLTVAGPYSFSNLTNVRLLDGTYDINVQLNATNGVKLSETFRFRVDSQPPVITPSFPAHATGALTHGLDNNTLDFDLTVNESRAEDTRLVDFVVEVVKKDESGLATFIDGTQAQFTYSRALCGTRFSCVTTIPATWSTLPANTLYFNDTMAKGRLNLSLGGLSAGEYRIRVRALDLAGNAQTFISGTADAPDFKVGPRLALVNNANTPFLNGNRVSVSALAGIDFPAGATDLHCQDPDGAGPSGATLCAPRSVTYYARNIQADGSAGSEVTLGSKVSVGLDLSERYVHAPAGWVGAPPSFWMLNLSIDQQLPQAIVTSRTIQVQARTAFTVNGVTYAAETPWVKVNSPLNPSVAALRPDAPWRVNTTGEMEYSIAYDAKVLDAAPQLRIDSVRATTPGAAPVALPALTPARTALAGSVHYYNGSMGSAASPLAPGEYTADFVIVENGVERGRVQRQFAVVTTSPSIVLAAQQPDEENVRRHATLDAYNVRPSFNLSLRVDHGLANITSDTNFTFSLTRGVVRDTLPNTLSNGTAGFSVAILNRTPYDDPARAATHLNVTVNLPTNALDGDEFSLVVNASTDARWSAHAPETSKWRASRGVPLRLDRLPPAAGVFDAATNATGNGSALAIRGFAEDTGGGVADVQVRVVDLTLNRTLLWTGDGGAYVAPGVDEGETAWATMRAITSGADNDPARRFVQNVRVAFSAGNRVEWVISQVDRPVLRPDMSVEAGKHWPPLTTLNNQSEYRVDVRARDALGRTSEITSRTVRFDTTPPVLHGTGGGHGIDLRGAAGADVGWHGRPDDAWFFVNVSDDKCLKRVSLRGIGPDGQAIGPVDLTPAAPFASCETFPRGTPTMWYTSARASPALTDFVGPTRLYLEAEDAGGAVSTARNHSGVTLNIRVVDAQEPLVRWFNLEPPIIGEGSTTTVRAEVFENSALDRVDVRVHRMGVGESITLLANGTLAPEGEVAANGTGVYALDLSAGLNVTFTRGSYLVQIRPVDARNNCAACPYVNQVLNVSDAAPPAITTDGASRAFVNATPTLAYRVLDRNVLESGVQVRAGASATSLAPVNATITPILGAGGARTGQRVVIAPRDLADGSTLLVQVTAAGNLTAREEFNYTVDAAPPAANHTVANLTTMGERQWAVAATRVTLTATDANGSGLASLTYRVNGGPEQTYTGPLTPTGTEGAWNLDYVATDNASNVFRGNLSLNVDRKGPVITASKHGDEPVVLVSDGNGVGLDERNVTLHYAYGDATAFTSVKMDRLAGTANAFTAQLQGNATTQGLRYWFEAKDRLGNAGNLFDAARPHVINKDDGVVNNTAPTVRITAPEPGASVRGKVELKWTSFDADGDALRVTIGLLEPNNPSGRFLVVDGDDAKNFTLNLTGFPAGAYTFTLVATDGTAVSESQTRGFVVEPGRTVSVQTLPPSTVQPGEEAAFAVTIQPAGKTLRTATFVVTRDGAPFTDGVLRQEGGVYAGEVTPTEPGDHRISVIVAYADGTQDPPVQVASFNVPAPPAAASFPVSLMVLLTLGVLTIALAAFGAFGRWK